jgi:hypothetical protein
MGKYEHEGRLKFVTFFHAVGLVESFRRPFQ